MSEACNKQVIWNICCRYILSEQSCILIIIIIMMVDALEDEDKELVADIKEATCQKSQRTSVM